MHTNKENTVKSSDNSLIVKELQEIDKQIIDEWFLNGFNVFQAVKSVKPSDKVNTIKLYGNRLMKKPEVKKYINSKTSSLRAETHIDHVHILNELLSFAYSDVTAFIGLNPDEIRALPPDIRRCIKDIETTTKSWKDPVSGSIVKEVSTKIKLIDKLKAIDMISRHIDFFNADNQSKGGTIDLTQATDDQLNAVLQLIKSQKNTNTLG